MRRTPLIPTPEEFARICLEHPDVGQYAEEAGTAGFYNFVPRPDCVEEFDQQASFCFNRDPLSILIGGNAAGCLHAAERIYDPLSGTHRRISAIRGSWHVWALDVRSRRFVVAEATQPRVWGTAELYRATLSNGRQFTCTLGHRVFDSRGIARPIGMLPEQLPLAQPAEPFARSLPSEASLRWRLNWRQQLAEIVEEELRFAYTITDAVNTIASFLRPATRAAGCWISNVVDAAVLSWLRRQLQSSDLFSMRGRAALCDVACALFDLPAVQGFPADCLVGRRFCDERSQLPTGFFPSARPSPNDARRPSHFSQPLDAREGKPFYTEACGELRPFKESPFVVDLEYVGVDEYWDFCVPGFSNYLHQSVVHHNTTEAASFKTALFVLRQQRPPRKDTPFWILANSYDQVGDVIWKEKLLGHGHIPKSEVNWDRISWRDKKKGQPDTVPLLPWPEEFGGDPNKNWTLHFKSYEQGRMALQAASIGGFFFSEQFPLDLLLETLRGCREYMFHGGQFCEFTPIDPELCIWVEKAMESRPPGWVFYRANTQKNRKNLADGWFDAFFSGVPDEILATRLTGQLATFEGVIYPQFNMAIHVTEAEMQLQDIPEGSYHGLATDWGSSIEHPQVTLLGAQDGAGTWYIYDEYFTRDQGKVTADHARAVVAMCQAWGWPASLKMADDGNYVGLDLDETHGVNHADPSGGNRLLEFSIRGIPTVPANNAVIEGINYVRSKMQPHPKTGVPQLIISRKCTNLIEQLRKYRWDKRANKSLRPQAASAPKPLKMEDDAPDALRYLLYSRRRRTNTVAIDAAKPKKPYGGLPALGGDSHKYGLPFKK